MIPITYNYKSFPYLWKKTVKSSIPQNWGEVTAPQLKAIIKIYNENISEVNFLKEMTGFKSGVIARFTPYERFKMMEMFEFLANLKPYHQFIIRKIHPTITGPALYAPDGKLKNVSFGQFIFCDTYFSNYQDSKDPDDLSKFIACLYLVKTESFSEKSINERAKYINSLNENVRQAIALNYQLMHEWLTNAYPLIFTKIQQIESTPENLNQKKSPSNWIKIFQNFVGDDVLNNDKWANTPVNTIFSYMTRKYKENARSKSKKY